VVFPVTAKIRQQFSWPQYGYAHIET
jgi:hypothetical protein